MRLHHVPRLLDLLRSDLARRGAMDAMLAEVADVFDVASASIAPAAATTWIPGESFAFNLPEGFSETYPAAQDPTQTFLAGQPGGVFCRGRSFDDSHVLFEVASRYDIEDAAVGNIDVLAAPRMKIILLSDRRLDDTHEFMLNGLYSVLSRALSARQRVLRPDLPYVDIDRRTGALHLSPAASRYLRARLSIDPLQERVSQALSRAAAQMARSGTRTRGFLHGISLSHDLHPADRQRMTLLLHDAQPTQVEHPAEWLLTVRQRQVARSAAAGATNRAIADELGIGLDTVKEHLDTVYRRLGVGSRGELMVLFAQ